MAALQTSAPTATPTPLANPAGLKRKLSGSSAPTSPAAAAALALSPREREKPAKRRKNAKSDGGAAAEADAFCWVCHKDGETTRCVTCPRVYHVACLKTDHVPKDEDWMCEACDVLMEAENLTSRSRAMRLLTVDQLGVLLKFALQSLRGVAGVEPFARPVDPDAFPDYKDYVAYPMDLATVDRNVRKKQYGSTEAFLGDVLWILHNCVVYNSPVSKLTAVAKTLVKKCRLEMQEIENCPDCYLNAHTKKEAWFVAACRIPHLLVWAKMTGFPYWPGKAMCVNEDDRVDVRFFGAHDKAWLPSKDVYLYSLEAPNASRQKKRGSNLDNCALEVDLYVKNVTEKYGAFAHAPPGVRLDPDREEEQIKLLYPSYAPPFELARRTRKYSVDSGERCPTVSPNFSDEDERDGVKEEADADGDVQDEATPMPDEVTPMSSGTFAGNEIVDDELMASGEEDIFKDQEASSDGPREAADGARAAASPPCEVSSTTLADLEKRARAAAASDAEDEGPRPDARDAGPTSNGGGVRDALEEDGPLSEDDLDLGPRTSGGGSAGSSPGKPSDVEEVDDDDDLPEIDDVEPDEELVSVSAPAPDLAARRPRFVAAVIAEPDAVALADAFAETNPAAPSPVPVDADVDAEDDVDDDEVEEISDEEEQPSAESNGAATEEERVEGATAVPGPAADDEGVARDEDEDAEEPEIDDVEPETAAPARDGARRDPEKEEEEEELVKPEEVDTSRLLASGVSVTVVERPAPHKADPAAPKVASDIGLGSDVSVTLVQKKKSDALLDAAAAPPPPLPLPLPPPSTGEASRKGTISVKNHRDLFQDPGAAKDIVQIQNVMSNVNKNRKPFPSKSVDPSTRPNPMAALAAVAAAAATSKLPPDPVVTISKVHSAPKDPLVSGGASLGPPTRGASGQSAAPGRGGPAPPVVSSPLGVPDATPAGRTTAPPVASMGPLASILGAPRMSGASYRPGGPQPPLRPGAAHSPLLRMAAAGPNARGSPHPPPNALPSLHPRPSFPPPGAGPVSEQLNKAVAKMTDYLRFSLEEVLKDVANQGSPEAVVKLLQIEMERMQYRHQQELNEVKQNCDLLLLEVRQGAEAERQKCVAELKKQFEVEKQKLVGDTKKKQWCAQCGKEAIFYCCWNTSYCDYPCQQKHWPSHMTTCAQNQSNQDEDATAAASGDNPLEAMEHHSGAASHFLGQVMKQANSRSQPNGMLGNRGFAGGPSSMSFNPTALNMNPRMASQLSMRYAAAAVAAQSHPRFPGQIRFPGSYFM